MRLRLGTRIILLAGILVAASLVATTYVAQEQVEKAMSDSLHRRATTIANTVGTTFLPAILEDRPMDLELRRLLEQVAGREEDVVSLRITDFRGRVMEEVSVERPGERLPPITADIRLAGSRSTRTYGSVEAVFVSTRLDGMVNEVRMKILIWSVLVGGAGILFAWAIGSTMTRPLRSLTRTAARLGEGDLSSRARISSSGDEISEMGRVFNAMAERIEENQRQLERDIMNLHSLQEFGRGMAAQLKRELLYDVVVESFKEQSTAKKVSLMIYDDASGVLRLVAGVGIDERAFSITTKLGETPPGRAAATGRPVRVEDLAKCPDYISFTGTKRENEGMLCLPLIARDDTAGGAKSRTIGVINLHDKEDGSPFTEKDELLLLTLADIAAVALENARLYELAITDGLTNLYIHRYFQQRMDEEIARHRRYGGVFSLLMGDIDHFKEINDTYGHQSGDFVLISIARIFLRLLREADIPCRYGGEEFGIILVDTPAAGAIIVAERIRETVEKHSFDTAAGKISVTMSIGISTHLPGKTKDEMIFEADTAMYECKRGGRNMCMHFDDIGTRKEGTD